MFALFAFLASLVLGVFIERMAQPRPVPLALRARRRSGR